MNPIQLSARYLQGYGANRGIQEAVDYGLGAAIGAGGQQVMNWATQGADPNPLLSGAMFAPIGAGLVRGGRGLSVLNRAFAGEPTFAGDSRNFALLKNQLTNPYTQAALAGSAAAMVGGASTSIYNTLAGGDDVDNNLVASGLGILGSVAPIAYSMLRGRNADVANSAKAVYNIPENSTGRYRTDEYHGVPSGYPRASANPDNTYQANRPDPTTPFRVVNVSTEPVARLSVVGALPYQRGGDLALRDPNLPTTSRVVVPPLTVNELALNTTRGRGWNVGKEFPLEAGLAGLYANSPRMR